MIVVTSFWFRRILFKRCVGNHIIVVLLGLYYTHGRIAVYI